MVKILAVLLVVLSVCVGSGELHTAVDESGCPPWTYRPNSTSPCQCGSLLEGIIGCNITTGILKLQTWMCVTYNPITNTSIAGYCPYSIIIAPQGALEYELPMTRNNFTNITCFWWKREGPLCSQCLPGYGIPLYSYELKCAKCFNLIKEVFKFLSVSLIPPTVLCIGVAVFHLNVLHPPWSAFVLVAQVLSTPLQIHSLLHYKNWNSFDQITQFGSICAAAIYGLWNLDFFRALYKPTCISPSITATQSYAIEGAIGLYPLVLLVVLYSFVTLRDRGCRVIVKIWKPFHFLLSRFQNKLNLKTSLIDTFATFFLLSYMKIGFAAFYVLTPTQVWRPDGSHKFVMFFNPSQEYFHSSHIGYAVITLLLALVVLIIPIILLFLYPCRCFHKCLNHFHLRLLGLHAFVDAFQGCYKDGTNGTRDCRYFAGLQLVLRLLFPLIFFFSTGPMFTLLLFTVVLGSYITLFVLLQPYKITVYNKTDIPLLTALLFTLFTTHAFHVSFQTAAYDRLRDSVHILSVCVPLLYLVIWSGLQAKHIVTRRTWCQTKHTQETSQLLPHVE